jgi:TolA-binding protein
MSRNAAPEDLLVRARRQQLDDEDERRLELSLNSSRELSLLYEAGVGFDAEASVLPGDEARAIRLVDRTLAELDQDQTARPVPRSRGGARYFALSVACGVLLSVAAASAWQYARTRWFAPASLELPSRVTPAPAAGPASPTPQHAAKSEPASEPVASPEPLSATPKPASAGSAKVAPSARELFTRASGARRRGDIEAAIALYEQLLASHPSSVEAEDARLVLGNLRLEQRSPRAALNQFESYGSGALSLEALWGKAEALRKLQSPDERTVLEQLVRDYPDSPYATAAQKRLQQLRH